MKTPKHQSAIDRAARGEGSSEDLLRISLPKNRQEQARIADIIAGRDSTDQDIMPVRASPCAGVPYPSLSPASAPSLAVGSVPRSVGRDSNLQVTENFITSTVDIGNLVRDSRRRLGMSQQRFADLAGVGRRFVSELEAGKPTIEVDRMLRCCLAAGIDILALPRNR